MALLGIDISHWQTYTPSLAGLSFVFCRATYGASRDGRYTHHAANVREAGLVLGAYHFGRSGSIVSVAAQVSTFLSAGGDADLLALDLESDGGNTPMTKAEAYAFIRAVQTTGRKIGLYHSESGFPSIGQDFNWVAKWSLTQPSIPWDFWQYRGAPLDLDRYKGTLGDLRALAAREKDVAQATITDSTEKEVRVAKGTYYYDLDNKTRLSPASAALDWRRSPYGVGTRRAIFATPGGAPMRLVLVTPSAIRAPAPESASYTVTVGGKTVGNVTLP